MKKKNKTKKIKINKKMLEDINFEGKREEEEDEKGKKFSHPGWPSSHPRR